MNWKMTVNLVASIGTSMKIEAMDPCFLLTVLTISGEIWIFANSTKGALYPKLRETKQRRDPFTPSQRTILMSQVDPSLSPGYPIKCCIHTVL